MFRHVLQQVMRLGDWLYIAFFIHDIHLPEPSLKLGRSA
jgi:hypothetical protein